MRYVLALLLLLFGAFRAEAAITLVHTDSATSGTTTTAITGGTFNLQTGLLIVVFCENSGSSTDTVTVTDTASNTFTSIATASPDSTHAIQAFYAKNTTANAADAVTCHYSPTAPFVAMLELVYTGADTTAPLDQSSTGNGASGTTATTSSFTTTKPNEVLTAAASWESGSNSFTAGTGYTLEVNDSGVIAGAEDEIVSSTQTGATSSMTNASSAAWMIVGATFKSATQPSGHSMPATGVGR